MTVRTLRQIMDGLPEERRVEIEKRAQELITEEMTRRDLRLARQKTQSHVAKELVLRQPWNQKGKGGEVWSGRPGC